MESIVLQDNRVVHRKELREHLNGDCIKGDRAKSAAQEEEWNGYANRKYSDRLTRLQERAEQCPPGNKDDQTQQAKAYHLTPMGGPDANHKDEHDEHNQHCEECYRKGSQHLPED